MATSGTVDFNPQIEEIIEEAYQRCGVANNAGYDLRRARRNLNVIFAEWANRGIHLWKVELKNQLLTAGQITYTTPNDCSDVLEAYISTSLSVNSNTQDLSLTKVDRSAYAALPNKGNTGQPSQYYVDRQTTPIIYLYQAPDTVTYTYLKYYYIQRIEDAGAYSNTSDVVFRFYPCLVSGLAYYLSFLKAPERTEQLKLVYEDELLRALDEDGQRTSLYIAPQTYFGDGV